MSQGLCLAPGTHVSAHGLASSLGEGSAQPRSTLTGPSVSVQGETPLHTACRHGLANLTAELLQQGANPNLQTEEALPSPKEAASLSGSADSSVSQQTPLHMAIAYNHPDVVSIILEQKGRWLGITAVTVTLAQGSRVVHPPRSFEVKPDTLRPGPWVSVRTFSGWGLPVSLVG